MPGIEFPIEVKEITFEKVDALKTDVLFGGKCGDMVAIRPCADEYENKTFLGILLGEIALGQGCSFNKETGELKLRRSSHNPAIFIPEKNDVVYGCESWWGQIKDEDHLRQITNDDIENVWYVRALKQLAS